MPEVLKHFIVANSAILFALTLIMASVGLWVVGKSVLRMVRNRRHERSPSSRSVDPHPPLADALLAAHHRIDQLEAMVRFDHDLGTRRRSG